MDDQADPVLRFYEEFLLEVKVGTADVTKGKQRVTIPVFEIEFLPVEFKSVWECSELTDQSLCPAVTAIRNDLVDKVFNKQHSFFDQPSAYRTLKGLADGFNQFSESFLTSSFA